MRKILSAAVLLAAVIQAPSASATISSFDDITFWTGTGSSRAALVIDFKDGTAQPSFAWGYRFDGNPSGAEMILDIVAADTSLSMTHSGSAASGFFFSSLAYTGDGSHSRTSGDFIVFPDEYVGWHYFISGGTSGDSPVAGGGTSLPSPWIESPSGAAESSFGSPGRLLADGAWDAWAFVQYDDSFNATESPSAIVYAAVPEPSAAALLMLALLAFPAIRALTRIHTA
jgi:hypothetical protein